MNFESALKELRDGKKVTLKNDSDGWFEDGEYLIASYITVFPHDMNENILTLSYINKDGKLICTPNKWGVPNWAIMSDDWEVLE